MKGEVSRAARYDRIGHGYARTRREDPRFRARIHSALGDARSVVNVGAGTGAYEPDDRLVVAVEPSAVMSAQRPAGRVPVLRAFADQLPLPDNSVDAAMAILTLHHWDDAQPQGIKELRRVARGRVVAVTYDARVSGKMWLMSEYLPELAQLDAQIFPAPEQVARWLGGDVIIEPMLMPNDTVDWMLGAFWAHPERVLDPNARAGTSGFMRLPGSVIERAVQALRRDIADGTWDLRHGHLRARSELDVGLRLIVAR